MTSSSTQQAVSSLNSLVAGIPTPPSSNVAKTNASKRKRRETMLSVQIDNATKTTNGALIPTLRRPTRTSGVASGRRQTRRGSQDVFEPSVSPPSKRAKSRDTHSTDEVPTNNASSNRPAGLRSSNGSWKNKTRSTARSGATHNQLSAHAPRQHVSKPRVTKPDQRRTRSSTAAERVTGPPPVVNRSKQTGTASDEEGTGDDEGFETAEEIDGEGREGTRNGGRERNSQLHEDQDGGGIDNMEQNGATAKDEFDREPFSLHKQGVNWRVIVQKARDVEKNEGRPGTDWAKSLVKKVHQITKDLKRISTRDDNPGEDDNSEEDDNLDDIATLEARVNTNLTKVENSLKSLPLAPVKKLQEGEMTAYEEQIARLGEIYSCAIPALVLFLQAYLSCRFRDSTITKDRLKELVTWQDSTIHLCDQARKWNARVTAQYKSPIASSVNSLIKAPLQIIRTMFNDELTRQKFQNDEAARQVRAEKEFRQFDEERRLLKEAKKARYEQYLIKSRDFFPEFMRNYKEGLRRSSVPDRPSASSRTRHPISANGPITSLSPYKGTAAADAGPVGQKNTRANTRPMEDHPWSEEEETYLIDALTQYKGNDRMKRILDAYGGPGGVLQHRGLGDLRRKVMSLKGDLATNPDTLDILGLI